MVNVFNIFITEATCKAAFLALPGLLQEKVDDIFVSNKDAEVSTAATECFFYYHFCLF